VKTFAADVRRAGANTVRGSCTCGWYGPERWKFALADHDVREHLEKAH